MKKLTLEIPDNLDLDDKEAAMLSLKLQQTMLLAGRIYEHTI